MDLSIRIRIIYNAKHRYIRLKFGDEFLTKLVLEGKASIYSTIPEKLLLYCHKFSVFVVVFII